jgi:hypothetical protein
MLTRSLVTSVLPKPKHGSLPGLPAWRLFTRRLSSGRGRSLRIQNRAEAVRARCESRHLYGRRDA